MDNANIAGRDEWRAARRALVEELTRLRDGFCHAAWADRETSHLGPMGFAGGQPILQTCA
jgi:hypothetical protein